MKDGKLDLRERLFRVKHRAGEMETLRRSEMKSIVAAAFGETGFLTAESVEGVSFSIPVAAAEDLIAGISGPDDISESFMMINSFIDSVTEDFFGLYASPGLLAMPVPPDPMVDPGSVRSLDVLQALMARKLTDSAISAGWSVFSVSADEILEYCPWCGRRGATERSGGTFRCGLCDAEGPVEDALVSALLREAEEIAAMGKVPVGEIMPVPDTGGDEPLLEIVGGAVTCVTFGASDYCAVSYFGELDEWHVYGKRMKGLVGKLDRITADGNGDRKEAEDVRRELDMRNEAIAGNITDIPVSPALIAMMDDDERMIGEDPLYEKYRSDLRDRIVRNAESRGVHVMRVKLPGRLMCPECHALGTEASRDRRESVYCGSCRMESHPDMWRMTTLRMIGESVAYDIRGLPPNRLIVVEGEKEK